MADNLTVLYLLSHMRLSDLLSCFDNLRENPSTQKKINGKKKNTYYLDQLMHILKSEIISLRQKKKKWSLKVQNYSVLIS